ncbi:subtilisin-like protease SBT5.4 [Macadamia integrifolia]|uniref:subtilisin-like protease SBT5.4 n=1 Tax=Macadamia integrifolia TaxID=60698 RepID=UPI001C53252D|nr:subtilisin-like protease SBT5.4 [Macadamia integrifolia]
MGKFSRLPLFLLPVLLFSMLQRPIFAIKKSYVVYMGSHSHGPEASQDDFDLASNTHYEFLSDFVGGAEQAKESIFYSYTRHINGFAATFEEDKAAEIAKHPKVISVFPNREMQLHTTRSWEFLGLEKNDAVQPGSIWEKARFGEDVIIGNLDSGVLPELKSFSGYGYGPIPSRWKGGCTDIKPDGVRCNRKLIGAKALNKGYLAAVGETFYTTRDEKGHGTHTLSTAAGNFIQNANVFGFGNGTAKGGSPRARVAAYRVCGKPVDQGGCFDADILAGFDAAIHDGVDVLSVSLGSPPIDFFDDSIAIGSFHAVKNGIFVVSSAGNSGPKDSTVTNLAPWLFTVAASTIDRRFAADVKLGNNQQFKGQSLPTVSMQLAGEMYPLVSGITARVNVATANDGMHCTAGSLDPKLVKGKIVVCATGETKGTEKGAEALKAGAVGMILVNGNDVIPEPQILPASHLLIQDGKAVYSYIKTTSTPTASISPTKTELGTNPAPLMASFSSKGPNSIYPEILKPDITAPGVNIIAGYIPGVGPYVKSRGPFNIDSGTSMSCPHVAGIGGLLKALYPHWSPAAIRSAIMTTASTRDNVRQPMMNSTNTRVNPFSYGAGHVRPNSAMDPGLVYDLTPIDYKNFLCAIGYNQSLISLFSEEKLPYRCPKPAISLLDFNYPSITVPNLSGTAIVTRKLKNVGSFPVTYKAQIRPPLGISVLVEPAILTFDSIGQEKTFKLTIKTKRPGSTEDYVFGQLKWSDGPHQVKSPIVVKEAAT